jgi:hypothetical protein
MGMLCVSENASLCVNSAVRYSKSHALPAHPFLFYCARSHVRAHHHAMLANGVKPATDAMPANGAAN